MIKTLPTITQNELKELFKHEEETKAWLNGYMYLIADNHDWADKWYIIKDIISDLYSGNDEDAEEIAVIDGGGILIKITWPTN